MDPEQIINRLKIFHPFRLMSEPQIALIIEKLEQVSVEEGTVIIKEGDESDYLYILMSGQVKLSHWVEDTAELEGYDEHLGTLVSGDIFGVEIWEEDLSRLLTAEALTNVTLLRIGWQRLVPLAETNPALNVYLKLMIESIHLSVRKHLDWRDPEEAVYLMGRTHTIFLFRNLLPSLLVGLIVLLPMLYLFLFVLPDKLWLLGLMILSALLIAISGIWAYVDWTNDYHIVTNGRVLSLERVILFYETRQESPLEAIQSVVISTGYWGRIFGYGDVVVRTYTGDLILRRADFPEQMASLIEEKMANAGKAFVQMEKEQRQDIIRQRLENPLQSQAAQGRPQGTGSAKAGPVKRLISGWAQTKKYISQTLTTLFKLRIEQGGIVTYRKHYFFLVTRTWVPTLILLLLPVFLGARLFNLIPLISPLATIGLGLLWFVLIGIWWMYEYIDWQNDRFILSDDQVVDIARKPLGTEEKQAAPLGNIQSIEYTRLGPLGLFFNYGTVFIRVGDDELTFDHVHNPSAVQREIFHRLAKRKRKEKMAVIEEEKKRMLDWLEAYHQVTNSPSDEQVDEPPQDTE